jgi:hypothetical protein
MKLEDIMLSEVIQVQKNKGLNRNGEKNHFLLMLISMLHESKHLYLYSCSGNAISKKQNQVV